MRLFRVVATIAGILLAGWFIADSLLSAIDREMEYREGEAVALRVEVCGEGYAVRYADALRRAEIIGGAVVHEADCRLWVASAAQAGKL